MIDQLYALFVNKVPGIKERYDKKRKSLKGFGKTQAWIYLLYLNIAYHVFRIKKIGESEKFPYYEHKKLYMGESESSLSAQISPIDFAHQLSQYDVISFDIFDTLIFRPFSEPTDLFYFVGNKLNCMDFKRLRIEMERAARKKKYECEKHYEVDLAEIYTLLSNETGIPKEKAMEAELETESNFCFANPYMYQVVQELLKLNKKLIVTSDMYLNTPHIKNLLSKCGYRKFSSYYISCDIKMSKNAGDLYEYIKDREGRELSYVHIGDNHTSDFVQAQKHGFNSIHYPNVNQTGQKYRPQDMSSITGGIYRGLVNSHLHNGLHVYSKEYEYGYVYGGLFVTGYCQMIHKYVHENQIDKILFLARDGDVLKKAYQILYPYEADKCEYVYWSRLAAAKLGAEFFQYDFFKRFLYHKINQGYTVQQIMNTMELEDMVSLLCSELKIEENAKLTDTNVDAVKNFLLRNWKVVLCHYRQQLEAGKQYYSEKLAQSKKAVAIDIGWAGSGAIILDYVVNNIWKLGCPIVGIVAGTNTGHNDEPDATEVYLQSGKLVSYLYSQRENRDIWKFHNPAKLHNLYWEMLLDAPMGSFKGFYLDGSQRYYCEFKKMKSDPSVIEEIQRGILDFVNQYKNLQFAITPLELISGRDAYAPMLLAEDKVNDKYMKRLCSVMDQMNVE